MLYIMTFVGYTGVVSEMTKDNNSFCQRAKGFDQPLNIQFCA